jgi:hypothetical protein
MFIFVASDTATIADPPYNGDDKDNIHLIMQYFIHPDTRRASEIRECFRQNILNPHITKIHLLGERIYTDAELGGPASKSEKVVQVNIGRRLRYSDFFKYVRTADLKGFQILVNSDIFFNATLGNLKSSDLPLAKKMMAILRIEYNAAEVDKSPILGPRADSQDTWIFHSNFPLAESWEKHFQFELGKPGCDNKLIYLLFVLGYEIVNDPVFINTYHYHTTNIRDYTRKDKIPDPYLFVKPAIIQYTDIWETPGEQVRMDDNRLLFDYVSEKMAKSEPFVIPRISCIETNFAVYMRLLHMPIDYSVKQQIAEYVNSPKTIRTMKNNAGILISSSVSSKQYSDQYLKAFENCEIYGGWNKTGHVYQCGIQIAQDFIENSNQNKRMFWAFAFDIFHYIYSQPWTLALRGKRILLVSAFEETLLEKIPIREKIYGIDLFPECTFLTIRPPQTQGSEQSMGFGVELMRFYERLDALSGQYDVALVSCGGYGALVCNHIYEMGGSAIYVGGVLQMYFGILGNRWLVERPDIVRMFLNEHWSRPKVSEKPKNCENIERACYW